MGRMKKAACKVTCNISVKENGMLCEMQEETGIPKTTLIEKAVDHYYHTKYQMMQGREENGQ